MKCNKCGFDNAITTQFCRKCGAPVDSSLQEVTEASKQELKRARQKAAEKSLFTAMILASIAIIPLIFFYFFLPDPVTKFVYITPPYNEARIPVGKQSELTFEANELQLPLPVEVFGNNTSLQVRLIPTDKQLLKQFFHPSEAAFETSPAINALIEKYPQPIKDSDRILKELPIIALALLAEGHSTGTGEHKEFMQEVFTVLYDYTRKDLRTNDTAIYAFTTLAYMENALLDTNFTFKNEVSGMLNRLLSGQDKQSGAWPSSLGSRMNYRSVSTLAALRTLGEANTMQLITLSDHEKEISLAYLKKTIETGQNAAIEPVVYHSRAWAAYSAVLLTQGERPAYLKDELSQLSQAMLGSDNAPNSIPGAHYLLLALYRGDELTFADYSTALLSKLITDYNEDTNSWPELDRDNVLRMTSEAVATAFIVRSFAFAYLYPKVSK